MRTKNAMQLKAIIRNRAEEEVVPPQLVMQYYLLERPWNASRSRPGETVWSSRAACSSARSSAWANAAPRISTISRGVANTRQVTTTTCKLRIC